MSNWMLGLLANILAAPIAFALGYLYRQRQSIFRRFRGIGEFIIYSPRGETLVVCGSQAAIGDANRIIRAGDVAAMLAVALDALSHNSATRVSVATVEEVGASVTNNRDCIFVGGPNVNSLTKAALRALEAQGKVLARFDVYTVVVAGHEPATPVLDGTQIVTDFGVIYSFPNPADPQKRVTVISGCLRVGTLAAARTLSSQEFKNSIRNIGRTAHHCTLVRADVAERDITTSRIVHSITRDY
ncbi:hypothetical protein M1L60_14360 [Actinoplanes sp. TRM 88003]|uniref:Uncharacterized protein n=1 Tax=Paractinoplanes aksuensis TaxID=2939490 RepID=A0ABT1DLR6_9ACTN|nr:hypothetical protein [Actinoplanes aksuensis]MCO8271777.1 hypothetical protein [Actinoplanes aksuensis]